WLQLWDTMTLQNPIKGTGSPGKVPFYNNSSTLDYDDIFTYDKETGVLSLSKTSSGGINLAANQSTFDPARESIFTASGGSGLFSGLGNLVIQPRVNAKQGIYFATFNGANIDYRWLMN